MGMGGGWMGGRGKAISSEVDPAVITHEIPTKHPHNFLERALGRVNVPSVFRKPPTSHPPLKRESRALVSDKVGQLVSMGHTYPPGCNRSQLSTSTRKKHILQRGLGRQATRGACLP
eukprot:EG_transcript_47944